MRHDDMTADRKSLSGHHVATSWGVKKGGDGWVQREIFVKLLRESVVELDDILKQSLTTDKKLETKSWV